MSTAVSPFAGVFTLDRTHSSFQFAVTHMSVSSYRASFSDIDATLVAADGSLTLEGSARVASVSIAEPPEFRAHVVESKEFFDGAAHPELTFRSTEIDLDDESGATVTGELTIKGVTQTITAHGTYRPPVNDPYGSVRAALELHATLDRRSFGLDWQAPLPNGEDVLGWDVEVSAHLELVRDA